MPGSHYFCYPALIWYMICPSCTFSSKRRTLKDLRFGESPDTWIVDVRVKPSKFPNNWKDLKIVKIEKQKSRPLNMSNILMWMALSIHLAKQSWKLKVHIWKISKSWKRRYQLMKTNIQTITFKICFLFLLWRPKILSKALIYAHPIFFGCKDCFLLCKSPHRLLFDRNELVAKNQLVHVIVEAAHLRGKHQMELCLKHCQRHNGPKALNTLTHSTP